MSSYSKKSRERLKTCHQDLQVIFNVVVQDFDNSIIEGERDRVTQNRYYSQGKSKLSWPSSRHNLKPGQEKSMAVDAVPYPEGYKDEKKMLVFAGWVQAVAKDLLDRGVISHGLRWGGDWDSDQDMNDQKFNDWPHYELVEL